MSVQTIQRLAGERDSIQTQLDALLEESGDQGRDLTEDEVTKVRAWQDRLATIDHQASVIGDAVAVSQTSRERLVAVQQSSPTNPVNAIRYRSAGELLYDMLHQSNEESRSRYASTLRRAAEHMGTDATKTVPTAGDLGGLHVNPNVGAVIDPYPRGMPLANAVGLINAPNSMHFMRPKIDDPDFATGIGPQGTGGQAGFEKAELPSKKFEVTSEAVALSTVGGYLNVSQQLISLQPGSLDLIIRHMNRRLAAAIDGAVAAEVTGTGATPIALPTTAAEMQSALSKATAAYYTATNMFPEWIAFGSAGYELLAGFSDAAGRPLFPYLGAANATGTNDLSSGLTTVAGLRPVLTPGITDGIYIGGADGVEGYIYRFPVLEAVEPSVLGRQVAVAAAVGTFAPIADSIQVIATS